AEDRGNRARHGTEAREEQRLGSGTAGNGRRGLGEPPAKHPPGPRRGHPWKGEQFRRKLVEKLAQLRVRMTDAIKSSHLLPKNAGAPRLGPQRLRIGASREHIALVHHLQRVRDGQPVGWRGGSIGGASGINEMSEHADIDCLDRGLALLEMQSTLASDRPRSLGAGHDPRQAASNPVANVEDFATVHSIALEPLAVLTKVILEGLDVAG